MEQHELIDELVIGNHILFDEGVVDGFGHLSARHPTDPKKFLLAWAIAPGIVSAGDILTFDLEGNVLDGSGQELYSERFIHAAIYASRPDVNGIVHSHSPAIIPFTIVDETLQPVWHMSAFLGEGVSHFDTQDVVGDSDLLIRNMKLGSALADRLGARSVALMRGHGSVAVGRTVREAVFRAIYVEANAKIQLQAKQLGDPIFINEGEALAMQAHHDADPSYRRPWEFWSSLVDIE